MTVKEASGASGVRRDGESGETDVPLQALLRLSGEISTKARGTRSRFLDRLSSNIRDAFESMGVDARLREKWSRLYVDSTDERALEPLDRIFGLSSYSPIEAVCEADLDRIVETGHRLWAERVRGRRYAVRARRAGDHEFSSYDVQRELGAALNPGAEVDLDDPEVTVRVEVRDDRAYLFSEREDGAGGLPLGVQGKALALVSGGYDSAVAAWMTLRRGVELDYLFCNLGGSAYERLVLEVTKLLADEWSYGTDPRIHLLDFNPLVEAMEREVKASYLQVVLKRLMYRAGCRVAREIDADAVVTGESVGQVSSQTLANLRAIDEAADMPVLRPLSGYDKEQIMDLARRIGTYDLSSRVREYCALIARHPVTAASPERAREAASAVDDTLLEEVLEGRRTVSLRSVDPVEIASSRLFVSEVEEDAVVMDVRPPEAYRRWHWPGAEQRDFSELSGAFDALDPERTYVLYCDRGTKTARLAEEMQSAGFEAYSFRGGTRALRRLAEESG